MPAISPINVACNKNLAFSSNEETQKPKRHPIKAVLLYPLPGVGQITNGDTKSGLQHLGIAAIVGTAGYILSTKKTRPQIKENMPELDKLFLKLDLENFSVIKFVKDGYKTMYKDVSKPVLVTGAVFGALYTANAIHSAYKTYKGKEV